MSENRTVIPGMPDDYDSPSMNGRSLYSRTNSSMSSFSKRTIIPGVDIAASESEKGGISKVKQATKNEVPVVGFLYSISRQGIGEYWPIHIGRNTIGRSEDCDICLREATVSDLHASLNIKQMKTTHKVLASIRDEGSRNGIFVNDEELDYSVHECKNHDRILVGDSYTLLLILIDADDYGLRVAPNFQATEESVDTNDYDNNFADGMYSSSSRPTSGTMSMDGSNPEYGKTRFL